MSGAAIKMQLFGAVPVPGGLGLLLLPRQGRDHPDPAELELRFNQLHLPELLHPEIHLQPQVQVSFHLEQGLSPTPPLCQCPF